MDPWLENRVLWQGFHNVLVAFCESALNRVLPHELVAVTEVRFLLDENYEEREAFITIREALHQETVLTVIELLSPSNKRGRGFEQYRTKQLELLQSETNLVEIDLLRAGAYTIALPENHLVARGARWDYLACIHDVTDRWNYQVWPIPLESRLPELPIPLSAAFPPVLLDLQAVLDECYDTGRYGSLLRYSEPPEVPLTEEQCAWVAEQLRVNLLG